MKITINNKKRTVHGLEAIFWGMVALLITAMTFIFTIIVLLGTFILVLAPLWVPILLLLSIFWLVKIL